MQSDEHVQGYSSPVYGFFYFMIHPSLWLLPLLFTLVTFLILIAIFTSVAIYVWPSGEAGFGSYTWGVVRAFGYATSAMLLFWVFLFPGMLALAFERMFLKIYRQKRIAPKEEPLFTAISSSLFITWKTLGLRIFWPVISLFGTLFLGPLGLFLGQMGLAHIALIDGSDLALALRGVEKRDRLVYLKTHKGPLLGGALVGGMLSIVLTTTLIGWLFFLPGLYVGALLLSLTKSEKSV